MDWLQRLMRRGASTPSPTAAGGAGSHGPSVADVLEALPPKLIVTLANLHGAPEGIPQITFQTLPVGSRIALLSLDLAVEGDVIGQTGQRALVPTRLASEVMAEAELRARRPELAVSLETLEERVSQLIARAGTGHSRGGSAPSGPLVETGWLDEHLSDADIRIVEVDEDTTAYEKGHIPGAVAWNWSTSLHAPVGRDFVSQRQFAELLGRSGVGPDSTVVLYGGNNNWFAAYAYWLARYLGFDNVRLVNGGRKKWELESREMNMDVPSYEAADINIQASVAEEFRALRDEVLMAIHRRGVHFVDVRSPEEFRGEKLAPDHLPQEQAQVPGHIPGAVNIPWAKAANEDGTFKPSDELRELYESAGITPDKEVIAYCRIGERSSHTWFVLHELLGYKRVKNYDGSWTEFGSLVGAPVEKG